jgi:glycosyltransferase involved in cell wall biosynthesis
MNALRIAMVVESMDTGVATLVSTLASELDARGHEIHLLHSVERTDPEVLRELRGRTGVRCAAFGMTRAVNAGDVAAGRALRRYLKDHGPFDVVHGHSSKGGALARLAAIGLPGVRVYTPHGFITLAPRLSRLQRLAYGTAERELARLSDAVICSSSGEARHAETLGIPREKLCVVANAIRPRPLSDAPRQRFGFGAKDSVVVGFVGRLEYQKGADVLLKAVARAVFEDSRIRAAIIGDGSLGPAMRELAGSLGISDRLAWLGRQPCERHLTSFDMLAVPSRYEGFSLMPLEAMHARLPVLCTPVAGIEETVSHGETGFVTAVDDCEALARAILTLARDPARRHVMGAAAHKRAAAFSIEAMVTGIERIYIAALERGLRGPVPATQGRVARRTAKEPAP